MSRRIIAIGDIHGCARALESLIERIDPQPDDLLISLGDYVDRGPDSRGVIDQLLALGDRCRLISLLGNHEVMMLGALARPYDLEFWKDCGGDATLKSYGGSLKRIPADHVAFVRQCRRYHETADHIFVHANYAADLSLDDQPDYLLFWEHISLGPPAPHESGKTVIVGHTPQPHGEILDLGHMIGIDTYCFGTGWLTGLDVYTGETWQVDKNGRPRQN